METDDSELGRCRVCGREENHVNLKNIFEDESDLELDLKIAKLLPVVVMPWDPLPQEICQTCIEKLNCFNNFYNESMKADRFLRTFIPTISLSETENIDPIVQINDHVRLFKHNLKLTPKTSSSFDVTHEEVIIDSEDDSKPEKTPSPVAKSSEPSMDGFMVHFITKTDPIYTCRECVRTYTTQSAALAHTCIRIENCGEFETAQNYDVETAEKLLPPLKIRLISTTSGKFTCYLCKKPFDRRSDIITHLNRHLVRRRSKENVKNVKKKEVKKRKKEEKGKRSAPDVKNCKSGNRKADGPLRARSSTPGKPLTKKAASQGTNMTTPETAKSLVESKQDSSDKSGNPCFSCVFCDKVFEKRQALIIHQKDHLENSQGASRKRIKFEDADEALNSQTPEFVCRICNMIFTKEKTLVDHERYHNVIGDKRNDIFRGSVTH